MAAIDRFRGEWFCLSNFYADGVAVTLSGLTYPSVEHAYQAAKRTDREFRAAIQAAQTPAEAAELGRASPPDPGWEGRKESVMLALLRQKFDRPPLRQRLLDTGDRPLVEGNTWGDSYWGVDAESGTGENRLGLLLQQVRAELCQLKLMWDSDCLISFLDARDNHAEELDHLAVLARHGRIAPIRYSSVSRREWVDTGRIEIRLRNLEFDPGFQPVPSVEAFRIGHSRIDGFAVVVGDEAVGMDDHIAQILKGDRNLGDRDQLLSAWLSQVDMFVSADNGFQKKRAALEAAVGFQICRPPEAVEQASKGASGVSAETSETGER